MSPISEVPRMFTLKRRIDETGISGVGRVLDGVIFHNGQVVVCWRSDVNDSEGFSSLGVYSSWSAFLHVHVDSHPQEASQIIFSEPFNPLSQDK